jgi:hypothetical protein
VVPPSDLEAQAVALISVLVAARVVDLVAAQPLVLYEARAASLTIVKKKNFLTIVKE